MGNWQSGRGQRPIVYVTFDGILTTLGHSQIVRVVTALARRGVRYLIVSAERAGDLADQVRVDEMRTQLAAVGVDWVPRVYDLSSTRAAAARNLGHGFTALLRQVISARPGLLHARGYNAALTANLAHNLSGTPYVFDCRGYWIDERVAEGRWFTRPSVYRAAKALERRLYRQARAVVSLTELQADDLRSGRGLGVACKDVLTIPTAADFDAFAIDRSKAAGVPGGLRAALAGRTVIGLVGSLNGSYLADDTARLCQALLAGNRQAHLLVLSEQRPEYEALFARHQIDPGRFTITQAAHEMMPSYLALIDWAPMVLAENFAKRASMPTKLGELFAAGVRPIHYGCSSEVSDWVRRVGTGIVLPSLDDAAFAEAARVVATSPRDEAALVRGREIARPHFGLDAAVDKYQALLERLTRA